MSRPRFASAPDGRVTNAELPSGVVSFLLTDVEDSTRLWETDAAAMDAAIALHDQIVAGVIRDHGGWLLKHRGEGDSTFSVFGDPVVAVDAAIAAQRALRSAPWPAAPVAVRMGVHMGEAVARDGDYFGVTVNRAARIRSVASGGEIAISETIAGELDGGAVELAPAGKFALRGITRPEDIWLVQWRAEDVDADRPLLRLAGTEGDEEDTGPLVPLPITVATDFVGREHERRKLQQMWANAKRGNLEIAYLLGEPGIGKSTLAAEVAAACHRDGGIVLFGRCDEKSLVPFQPFVEALGALSTTEVAKRARRHLGRDADHLAPLMGVAQNDAVQLADLDPETRRFRMFDTTAKFLSEVTGQAPTVLLLDDLQWADEPTMSLLHHVARINMSRRLFVIATVRSTEVGSATSLARTSVALGRETNLQRLHLPGLSASEIASLVAGADGDEVGEREVALADVLLRETSGNALFVREMLGHLREIGSLARGAGWRTPTEIDNRLVPERVQDVIGQRLGNLTEATEKLLTVAAVLGPEFSLPVLQEMTQLDEDALLESIDEALVARFIVETDDADRFVFAHALVRTSIYGRISLSRRARHHARAGAALEAMHANEIPRVAAELSLHFREASSFDREGKARTYALIAAEDALARLAFEDAARLFADALADTQGEPLPPSERTELFLKMGDARWASGSVGTASAAFADAAREARAIGDVRALARAALGYVGDGVRFWWIDLASVNEPAIALLEEAHAALVDDVALRARVQACLAQEIFFVEGSRERRLALSAEAVAMARQLDDPRTLAAVLADRNLAIFDSDHIEERHANADELYRIGMALGDTRVALYGAAHRGVASAQLGDIEQSASDAVLALQLAEELRRPHFIGIVKVCQGMVAQHHGDLDACERFAIEGFRIGWEHGDPNALLVYAGQMLGLRRDQDRLPEVVGMAERMADVYPRIPGLWSVVALGHALLDHTEAARAALDRLVGPGLDALPRDSLYLPGLCAIGETAVLLDDATTARGVYDGLVAYEGRSAVIGAFGTWGITSTVLGMLAAFLGDHDAADEHFRIAVKESERFGSRFMLTRALVTAGEAQLRRNAPQAAREFGAQAMAVGAVTPELERRARLLANGEVTTHERVEVPHAGIVSRARSVVSIGGRSALARLTRNSDDGALIRNARSATAQRTLFSALARSYQPTYGYGFEGTLMIELDTTVEGSEPTVDTWSIEVTAKKARARRGPSSSPAVTVRLNAADFVRLVAGTLNPIQAFKERRLTVQGDVLVAARMDEMFGGVAPN